MRLAALLALCLAPIAAPAQVITAAEYSAPTTRYPHGVLGDAIEWGRLTITVRSDLGAEDAPVTGNRTLVFEMVLPQELVFEDTAPRLWDVTGDGQPEVVVVQSHADLGARLLVIGLIDGTPGQVGATPFIGQTNRWLAPIGAVDLDGDGQIEVAYIDRPHLARTLRVWRLENGDLAEVASLQGLTNHRIGEADIAGGIRDCGQGPEMIVANADWSRLMAVTLSDGMLAARGIGPHRDRSSFAAALACSG